MALIKSQIKKSREAVTVKLDTTIIEHLKLYAEFIESSQEHVVNEALLYTFHKDKDFQKWLLNRGESAPKTAPAIRRRRRDEPLA